MRTEVRGTAEMVTAMAVLGTIGWFVIVSGQAILDVVFWRCMFGAITLLIICAAMGVLRGAITFRLMMFAALGGVALVLNWLLLFASFSRASISIATAVYNTQPFMLIVFGWLLFSEQLTITKVLWLAIAFMGLLLILQAKPDVSYVGTDYLAGILMALGAAFFWAVAAIITKKLRGTPPQLIAFIQVCVGIVMLAPFANFSHPPASVGAWSALITIGVVHTGLMFVLMYDAVQKLPTHHQGSLSFIYPVIAIVVDFFAFGNRLHMIQFVGAAVILISAFGMNLGWSLWKSTPTRDLE